MTSHKTGVKRMLRTMRRRQVARRPGSGVLGSAKECQESEAPVAAGHEILDLAGTR